MPVSTFNGLQTALRGLLVEQRSIDVTGHNIANVGTPGYSRQEATLIAAPALTTTAGAVEGGRGAQLGTGVDVQTYRRVRDGFLDAQYRAQSMRLGYHTATATALSDAEIALAEPGSNGIAEQLGRFWDAWADLANAPEDPAARQAPVQQGRTLTSAFATVDAQLGQLSTAAAAGDAALTAPNGKVDATASHAMPDTVTVSSRRFGDLVLRPEDLIDFPRGLVGLGGCRYVVVRTDADSPFRWLQSAEDPDLALPITDPWAFFPAYALELSDAVTADAGLPEDGADGAVWVTVRATVDRRGFSANLRAPIVVHAGRGHQVLNEARDAPVRAPLFPRPKQQAAGAATTGTLARC